MPNIAWYPSSSPIDQVVQTPHDRTAPQAFACPVVAALTAGPGGWVHPVDIRAGARVVPGHSGEDDAGGADALLVFRDPVDTYPGVRAVTDPDNADFMWCVSVADYKATAAGGDHVIVFLNAGSMEFSGAAIPAAAVIAASLRNQVPRATAAEILEAACCRDPASAGAPRF